MPLRLSVVIPAYKAERHLGPCLAALGAQDVGPPLGEADPPSDENPAFEVVVVDDGSPGADIAPICARHGARLIRHEVNRGAAAARNTGVRHARSDLLLFIDSDLEAAPDLVRAVLRWFEHNADQAVVTGWYDKVPANDTAFAHYKALWTWFCWDRTTEEGVSDHFQGALTAMRRAAWQAVGGFDEKFAGGNVEDYEMSQRLREAGHPVHFHRGLMGRHHFPGFRENARRYFGRARMWLRLQKERPGFSSGQANPRAGALALLSLISAGSAASLPLAPLLAPLSLPLWSTSTGLYLVGVAPFARFCLRERGPFFAAYAVAVNYALSATVGAGAVTAPLSLGGKKD